MSWLIRLAAFVLVGSLAFAKLQGQSIAGDDDKPAEKAPEITVTPDPNEPTTLDQGTSISPTLLAVIDDNSAGIRPEERAVYFRGLKLAQETPKSNLKEAADKLQEQRRKANPKYAHVPAKDFPQFVDLFENPDVYRGRAVSLRGTIRRLTKYDPGKNNQGIKEVYEGWIYTADSNSNPAVVIFTSKPPELVLGADITDEIRATGYFFKIYDYQSQGGPGKAPMLLAGTVDWHPGPRSFVFPPISRPVYVILTLTLLVLGYGMWKANSPGHVERLLPHEEVDLTKLPPVDDHA